MCRRGCSAALKAERTAAGVAKRKRKIERQLASGDVLGAISTLEATVSLAPDDRDVLMLKFTAESKLQEQKERRKEKRLQRREKKAAKHAKLFFIDTAASPIE